MLWEISITFVWNTGSVAVDVAWLAAATPGVTTAAPANSPTVNTPRRRLREYAKAISNISPEDGAIGSLRSSQ